MYIWKADLCDGGSLQSGAQLVVFRLFVMCCSVVCGARATDKEMQRQTDSQTGKYTLNASINMSYNLVSCLKQHGGQTEPGAP